MTRKEDQVSPSAMLLAGAGEAPRHVGLRPDVRYRVELGFAFVDDGDRLFKMSRALFEQAIGARPATAESRAQVEELVRAHGTVFALFETEAEASMSVEDTEI
jgi:hypothetical protein